MTVMAAQATQDTRAPPPDFRAAPRRARRAGRSDHDGHGAGPPDRLPTAARAATAPPPPRTAKTPGVRDNRTVTLQIRIKDGVTPPYEQVRAQISEQARSGALPVGYRLPTVRALAESLGLAANTVAKAYRALESDGVIETRGRNGTFVAAAGSAAERQAAEAAQAYAERVRRLGLEEEAALAAVRDALRAAYAR
jgi:DNA-binding transcriptional regulator YhcF (GntR family)